MKKITLLDVKYALKDTRFREQLPDNLKPGAEKFIKDPGCACNHKFIKQVLREAKSQLFEYFPAAKAISEVTEQVSKNNWRVISCHIDELESKLQSLPRGRVQLDVARWQDQVTVIINDLELIN